MTEATTAPKAKKTAKAKPTAAKSAEAVKQAAETAEQVAKTAIEQAQGIITELTRTNFEETVETARAVLKSGDIRAAVELQSEFMRAVLKRNIDAAREINEIAVSAVKEATAPYTTKFTEAFEKLRAA